MAGEEGLFNIPPPLDDFNIDSLSTENHAKTGTSAGIGQLGTAPMAFSPPPLSDLPPLDSFDDFPVINAPNQTNGFNSRVTNNDDDFGDFTSSELMAEGKGNNNIEGKEREENKPIINTASEFGDFSTFSETGNDGFGEFTTTSTNDNGFSGFANFATFDQNISTSGPSNTTGSGNDPSLRSPPPLDDDFGDFGDFSSQPVVATPTNTQLPIPPPIDEGDNDFGGFGNFTSQKVPKSTNALPLAMPPPLDDEGDDDFGDFTSETLTKSIIAPVATPPLDDFGDFNSQTKPPVPAANTVIATPPPLDDDFGDFGDFTSQSTKATTTADTPLATPTQGKIKVCVDVLVACFPLKPSSESVSTHSTNLYNESYITELSKEVSSTSTLYQWSQSLLQDRFFNSLKVDPMLVPSSGSSGNVDTDPFALTNLLADLGSGLEVKSSGFGWSSNKENDVGGAATLLDLSLPMSPTDKNAEDAEGVLLDEDLKELDFNTSLSKQSPSIANVQQQEGTSSWMDSELLELEKELPEEASGSVQPSSTSGNLEWLNNPNLTTMVKPPQVGDSDGMDISLFPSLEPTSSSIVELELLPDPVPQAAPPTTSPDPPTSIKTSSDSLQIDIDNLTTSSSPDPLSFGLIPPDPIISVGTDPANSKAPEPILPVPDTSSMFPDPIFPASVTTEQQKIEVASNALNMVMEMTNKVTVATSPTHLSPERSLSPSSRLSLIPPKSSIDIIEDQLLEMTRSKAGGHVETMKKTELSKESWSLLNSLPDLSFMRKL